jgi:methylenetetrahydrofolate reductase (NADPH)
VGGLRAAPDAAIAGFHLFPFGGLRKAADWLRDYGGAGQGALPIKERAISHTMPPKP